MLGAELSPAPLPPPVLPSSAAAEPRPLSSGPPAGATTARVAGRHARPTLSPVARVLGRVGDTLPPGLRGGAGVTAQHVTVVALVLAAAMALAAWLLMRAAPQPQAPVRASLQVPAAAPVAPSASVPSVPSVPSAAVPGSLPSVSAAGIPPASPAAPSAGSSAGSVSGVVVVHVAGRVRRPGVVELPAGSRVVDALEAAGGARTGARLSRLNLARVLVDGEQIAVGVPAATGLSPVVGVVGATPTPGPGTSTSGGLVNLNTASQAELEELPGVGPVTATSILEWRTEHGGFTTVDELLEVSGIGEVTLAELRDLVTV
jgi:competence protein ComEA